MLKFGTDGLRGVANTELTPELVLALGRAAARILGRHTYLVGRDTRRSGPLLQAALAAGLASEGAGVIDVGVLPTPGVARLAAEAGAPAAMISGSHNPYADNGVKLFAPGGRKLSDAVESQLEAELVAVVAGQRPTEGGAATGEITADPTAIARYQRDVVASLEDRRLTGLRVVLDCANGAASGAAPAVFTTAGADVHVVHADPDGININDGCGSTHPAALREVVIARGADAGLAFDGDADRVIAVDREGRIVDGDEILAICGRDLRDRGRLAGDTIVATVMSNLGFRLAMAEAGIRVVETNVGDRYVLEALEGGGWSLGGEQSGHVIFADLASTGDGLLTGLQLLDVVCRSGRSLAELAGDAMTKLPQVLHNVKVLRRDELDGATDLWAEVEAVAAALGGHGRVLLRPSGTEQLVRVMVEAPTVEEAEQAAQRLCTRVTEVLGSQP